MKKMGIVLLSAVCLTACGHTAEPSVTVSVQSTAESITECSEEPVSSTVSSEEQESQVSEPSEEEQMAEDRHTAAIFTDDETFNALFQDNALDRNYQESAKDAVTLAEMRQIAGDYAERWKQQVQNAYERLKELLADNPQELEKLEISQQEWMAETEDKKKELYDPSLYDDAGSMELLGADTAMMNDYKGRAAALYRQIWMMTGKMEME